ncbi:hypothetical protein JCM10213_008747 [Rhodosporidiobolus nylandii]
MSAMQNVGKGIMRVAKNSIKGYSDTQTKVRDATSNDPWGPSGTQMSEIAALTFNQNDFVEIIEMLDKRLNDKGKNWRHVFKSLTVLDYILHAGSENVVQYFRENLYIIKTLKEFQYIDEYGKDQGANVRQKAKDITNLLLDEKRMKSQRATRKDMRNRMAGERPDERRERPSRASPPAGGADADLQAAIEASKRSAQDEARRGRREQADRDLEEAMRLSKEEEERRQRELAASGGGGLFDEQQQNDSLIDMNAPQQQQPMQTGWASFNPYAAQQQAQMEEYMRQQQLLELQRQQEQQQMMFAQQQQQAMQAQYAQQQAYEEHMRQQQMLYAQQLQQQQQQPQQLQPQPTGFGANNPFAAFASPPPQTSSPAPQTSYQPPPPESAAPAPAPVPEQSLTPQRTGPRFKASGDAKHSELAQMLASGSGLDTFGNVGNARMPVWAQKTGEQGMNGQGPMVPQTTGLAKPVNPFGQQPAAYAAPVQFNQPTGYQGQGGQGYGQQQQQQQNHQPLIDF